MSSSQFDDLLGDFGNTGNTTKTAPNGDNNSELLLDFGGTSQVTNGQVSSNGVNPLYDLDSQDASPQQQQPPQSSNPLYDLDFNTDTTTTAPSSNPLYEFENTTTAPEPEPASSNPFQDFEDLGGGGTGTEPAQDNSVDLLSGTIDQPDTPANQVDSTDLLGDFNSEPQAVDESNTMQEGDSGIQSEHNGSSSLLDDFAGSGVTITTTTTQDQEQTEAGEKGDQEEEPCQGDSSEKAEEEIKEVEANVDENDDNGNDDTNTEALPDLVVKEEGDEEQTGVADQETSHVDEEAEEAHEEESQSEEATQEDNTVVGEVMQEDGARSDEVAPDEEAQSIEASGAEGAHGDEYSADRREEDLEQYCIDREEETSEVSEGVVAADEGTGSVPVEEQQTVDEEVKNDEEDTVTSANPCDDDNLDQRDGHNDDNLDQRDGHNEENDMSGDVDAVDEQLDEGDQLHGQQDERDQVSTQQAAVTEEPLDEVSDQPEEEVVDATEEAVNEQTNDPETANEPVKCEDEETPRESENVEDVVEQVEDAAQQPEDAGDAEAAPADVDDVVVEESPAEKPQEEEEIVEVTTTTSVTEDKPYEIQGFEVSSNETQESSPSQWPPVENSDQQEVVKEAPRVEIQEEEPAPTKQSVDIQQEMMSSEGGVSENQPQQSQQWEGEEEEEEEEGVYENEPVKREDVARESDKIEDTNLPSPGLAQNLLAKFSTGTASNSTPRAKREITPPNPTMGGGEYVSEPRVVMERYEGKAESGVFESEPQHNPEVVRSDSHLEEALPQQGSAKMFAARYAQIDHEGKTTVVTKKKEINTDRDSGPVEYVSEPRGFTERYEGKAESGVFESQPEEMPDVVKSGEIKGQDPIPERGTAKNLAQRFHQISVESASPVASSRTKRELTPDQSGRTEYVSEPRAQMESYQAKVESGVFENTPQEDPEVVKSETAAEEYVPERGYAKNVAAKFKELESTAKSPPLSPGRRKEFTPPREDQTNSRTSGVYESTPETKTDVITSTDSQQEVLPGAGTAKSLAQRYKQIEEQSKSPVTSKAKKELTPPPNEVGVFENKPERFEADYNRPAESGILENTPVAQRDDVLRGSESNTEVDLPEAGTARNLVSKWRQIESESAKNTSPGSAGGRHKEFTPPREEPRIMQNSKSPITPKSPGADSSSHQLDNGSVHPSDLPGQYQPQNEPHVFESSPEARSDALREADTDKSHGLPKKNQAKKMLARFQSIQAEANKEAPKPVSKKQQEDSDSPRSHNDTDDDTAAMEATRLKFEDPDQVGRSKSMRAAIQVEKCGACDKTVYAMERLEMNKRVYHRACFRCSQCKAVLTPKTFAINNEVIFCTTHYKQNFTTKGNYDEGFGRQQHKKHWNSNPNIANSVSATNTTTTTTDSDKS